MPSVLESGTGLKTGSPKLPFELYPKILQHLPINALLKTALVCQDFQVESEIHIYRTITIDVVWFDSETKFKSFMRAFGSQPLRQRWVRGIYCTYMRWENSMQAWKEMFDFLLSTLTNIKTLAIPITLDSSTSLLLDAKCRLEVWHIERVELQQEDLMSFYKSQHNIKELSIVHLDVQDHPDVATVLPKLESIGGTNEMIMAYGPGHPITKVHLNQVNTKLELEKEIFPALRQSTGRITHFRLFIANVGPEDLMAIANELPSLRVLHIIDIGDSESVYSHLSVSHLDSIFAPLVRLSALEDFKFHYSAALHTHPSNVGLADLSRYLPWRDKATPRLRSIQLNQVTLNKDNNGVWRQRRTTDWMRREWGKPSTFPWRE